MSVDRPDLPADPILYEDGDALQSLFFNGTPIRQFELWTEGRVGRSPEGAGYAADPFKDQIAGDQSIRGYNFRANAFTEVHSLQVEDHFTVIVDGLAFGTTAMEPSPIPGGSLRFHCRRAPEAVFIYFKAVVHANGGVFGFIGQADARTYLNYNAPNQLSIGGSSLAPQGHASIFSRNFMNVGVARSSATKGWNSVTTLLWDSPHSAGGSTRSGQYIIGASELFVIVSYKYD